MKRYLLLILILAVSVVPLTATASTTDPSSTLELMPVPRMIQLGQGALTVTADLTVLMSGEGATPRLQEGARRMLRRLSDRTGLFFPPATFLQLTGREAAVVKVHAGRVGEVELGENESYRLQVTPTGIDLEAETDIGALRGLQTLLQLVTHGDGKVVVPVVTIDDSPRFPWRGLMIDSSRHFMPVEVLKRNLDGMAAVKLNVLHWHLCDDQGFRFESLAFPKLQQHGSDGFYYTRAQLAEVIDYATARGIRVVPELDLPGHATSWLVGYPELGSQPGPYEIERGWGIYKPTIDPTREEVYEFLDTLLGEVAAVFPDAFVHIGGDENTGEHWAANPDIQAFMADHGFTDAHALQQYFSQRMQKILDGHGKRMVGWDEILQPELPTSIVIQSWRGREALYQAAQGGYSGILSNGYYIDLIQPTSFHYLNDPLPESAPISAEESRRVLGGEATMWAEFVTPETVDSRIWPRTAAIAERLWSPGSVRDLDDMYRRLDRISLMLEELGLQHERNQEMMLRRLCGCRDVSALLVLVGAIEPVKIYRRGSLRAYTSFSPLTRLVDAAWPDAAPSRRFSRSVERLLERDISDPAELAAARAALQLWQGNHTVVAPMLADSPALAEMTSLSHDLAAVAAIGLEALDALATGTDKGEEWLAQQLSILAVAREPRGEAELMVIEPIHDLACRAAGTTAEAVTGCQEEESGESGGH